MSDRPLLHWPNVSMVQLQELQRWLAPWVRTKHNADIGDVGGTGSITQIVSTDATVDVTGGTGPIVDLSVTVAPAAVAQFDIKVFTDRGTVLLGDGRFIFAIPSDLNGWNLTAVAAYVTSPSSSGKPTVQIGNLTTGFDMLTTKVSVDVSESTSYTASVAPVISAAHKQVSTGDLISIDVDIAGTGTLGLGVMLTFTP